VRDIFGEKLEGITQKVNDEKIKFIFLKNLGKYGKYIRVRATAHNKSISSPIFINAQPEPPLSYIDSVKKVDFTSGVNANVNFNNLSENDIYLVKINKDNTIVNASDTGGFPGFNQSEKYYDSTNSINENLPLMGHIDACVFNANPPPIEDEIPKIVKNVVFVPPVVGDTKMFWVESFYDSGTWVQKQATLRATGVYENIWVADENFGQIEDDVTDRKITIKQAEMLAEKFDLIYPLETNLLGFEYGGGPDGDGGKDGDPKIQILVYDIVDDTGEVKAAGYFWGKDHYSSISMSNLAEIFYLNTSSIDNSPDYMYSCLSHEFQHMINFNMKYVKHGKNSDSWYDEMLSEMTEDVISPLIGVDPQNWAHPSRCRISTFLDTYNQTGITEWNRLEDTSYAKGYAFGAYLMRNYGGALLLSKILANDMTNIDSITAALSEISPGTTFETALEKYGEALIFSGSQIPEGACTFDRTVNSTVNGASYYTVYKFDIWKSCTSQDGCGPLVFGLTPMDMRPHSIVLHSTDSWKNINGNFSITLEKPNNPNIEFYLIIR
jgi:hypothetical protein